MMGVSPIRNYSPRGAEKKLQRNSPKNSHMHLIAYRKEWAGPKLEFKDRGKPTKIVLRVLWNDII